MPAYPARRLALVATRTGMCRSERRLPGRSADCGVDGVACDGAARLAP
jgi:hypothetical protein